MQYLGAFAEIFTLHPWDVDRLTAEQFDAYCDYIDEMNRQSKAAKSNG